MFVILIFPVINGRHVNKILINSKTWSSQSNKHHRKVKALYQDQVYYRVLG